MKISETSLGSIGTAAMAYVSHITDHLSLCMYFLVAGTIGAALSIVASVIYGIVKSEDK